MESNSNKITGVVAKVFFKNGTTKEGKPYEVRQLLISEINARYPQSVLVDAFGEKFSAVHEGVVVDCFFNLAANEYNGKYYNRISAWRIVPVEGQGAVPEAGQVNNQDIKQQDPKQEEQGSLEPKPDDLPF